MHGYSVHVHVGTVSDSTLFNVQSTCILFVMHSRGCNYTQTFIWSNSNIFPWTVYKLCMIICRCGGGLGGLKKQGNANAAFSKMIQNYSTVFEVS